MPNTASVSITEPNTDDATYRTAWTSFISLLSSAGWVQAGDSGQATLASMLRTGHATNFQIWHTNDSLTAIYMKIFLDYNSTGMMNPQISFGTGSDGSGNLTGPSGNILGSYGPVSSGSSGGTGTNTYQICWEASGGSFILAACVGSNTNPYLICVERSRDSSGAPTAARVDLFFLQRYTIGAGHALARSLWIDGTYSSNPLSPALTTWPCGIAATASLAEGGDIGVSAVRALAPQEQNTSKLLLLAESGDFASTGQFSTTVYGASHNYMALGTFGNNANVYPGGSCQPCMLWE